MDQTNLLEKMVNFNNKSRTKTKEGKHKKQNTFDSVNALDEGQELTLNAFRSGILPIKEKQRQGHPLDLAHVAKVSIRKVFDCM